MPREVADPGCARAAPGPDRGPCASGARPASRTILHFLESHRMQHQHSPPAIAAEPDLPVVIRRRYAAPRDLVFAAWTRPEHMREWFCPAGFTVLEVHTDVRPGGRWHTRLAGPDGRRFIERGIYIEIVRNDRLRFTHSWESEDGEISIRSLVEVTFVEEAGSTEMTFTQSGLPDAKARERHRQGWSEAFDFLDDHLRGPGRN